MSTLIVWKCKQEEKRQQIKNIRYTFKDVKQIVQKETTQIAAKFP